MATRKLSRKEREEIKQIFDNQRASGRCKIVRELMAQRDELTKEIDAQIQEVTAQLNALNQRRGDLLKKYCLADFDEHRRRCSNLNLHPTLDAYDEETNRMLVSLLTEETVPTDIKAVLAKALA